MAESALNKAPGDGPDGLSNPVPTWSFVPFQALPGTITLPLPTCSQLVTISQKSDTKGHKFKYFRAVGLAEAARHPRITIQVFPFAVQDCPGSQGPVTIFDFADSPSLGYAEGHEAGRIIEASIDMARLGMMFDHLRAGALNPAESARFIDSVIRGDRDE